MAGYVSLADGTASDNTTEITGGTINGTIYAAYSHSGTLLSNKVILAGNADVNGDVYINGIQAPTNVDHSGSMEVFGSALLDGASLHGYVPENESSSNGGHYELSIHDYSGKIHSLDNFNNVEIKDSIATIELADGQMFGGGGSGRTRSYRTSFKRGFNPFGDEGGTVSYSDRECTVSIDMYTALLGGSIIVQTPDGDKLKLKIKPGTQPGTKVRLKGKGDVYPDGTRGNLILTYNVQLPTNLSERQKDLLQE